MPLEPLDSSETAETFAAEVVEFTTTLPPGDAAKLVTFFHLAVVGERTKVDLNLAANGRLQLVIEADGDED